MEIPKYCRKCGKLLEEIAYQVEFDPQTGEQVKRVRLRCPDFGMLPYFNDHDIFFVDTMKYYGHER